MVDEDFTQMYQHLSYLREACKRSGVVLPESVFDASTEISTALSASNGDEEVTNVLLDRDQVCLISNLSCFSPGSFEGADREVQTGTKREHSALTLVQTIDTKRSPRAEFSHTDVVGDETPVDLEEDEVGDENNDAEEEEEDGDEPPRKLSRLAEDVHKKSAAVASNQVIVNAFTDYGEQQLHRGHTGKGVTHLRAARAIRDYPHAITSGDEARGVRMVGPKMATQIEQILNSGKLEDKAPWLNVSTPDVEEHKPPRFVLEVRNSKTKRPENQMLVDELAKFGEHELYFRSGSKGTTHLRAARALQRSNAVITSGDQARRDVPRVGSAIADKIDQILKYGRIVSDTPSSSADIRIAPIVKYLSENAAVRSENQSIVDALLDYGDCHLHSGHRGRGITHLRAAKAIRDADIVVTSGEQAVESIKLVGAQVSAKVDQLLKHGHLDTDEDDDDGQDDESSEFGVREPSDTPPIVHEVRSKRVQIEGNQEIVNALSAHGEMQLGKWHTGQGTAFMRAARHLCDAAELVTSGSVAKALGCIGDKVVTFIDTMVVFKSTDDAVPGATEEPEK